MKIALALLICVLAANCSSSHVITVQDGNGTALEGIPLQLAAVDDSGQVIETFETKFTDGDGKVRMDVPADAASSLVFQAVSSSLTLRAFASDVAENGIVNPVSEGLVTAVVYVTETDGGRTLSDFSSDEVRDLSKTAHDEIVGPAVDLTDEDSVVDAVISALGREIADAAGGFITAVPLADIVGPDVTSAAGTFTNNGSCDGVEYTADFFVFDVNQGGGLCNVEAASGTIGDAYDGASQLVLVGDTFDGDNGFPGDPDFNVSSPIPPVVVEDDRELVFGPVTTDSGNLEVTRKVMVPEGEDIVRNIEIFRNLTASDLSITFQILGDFGGLAPYRVVTAQKNDNEFTEESDYGSFVTLVPNARNPLIGFVLAGPGAAVRPENVTFPLDIDDRYVIQYSATLVGSEKAVFAYYSYVSPSLSYENAVTALESIHASPDMTGLSASELNHLRNFKPSVGNVVGEAGSVASNAEVTLTASSGAVVTVEANRDGSFKAALDLNAGDSVAITGSDGTATSSTVQ